MAQLGQVLGLLVTGNAVRNTQLMGDDETGEPTTQTPEKHNIPVLGAVLVGLLPLGACGGCLYLAVCLTVRMTPIEGNRRGAVGAIALFGVLIAVLGHLLPAVEDAVHSAWPVLSFAVGMLLFLLLVSLLITGVVELIRIVARNE